MRLTLICLGVLFGIAYAQRTLLSESSNLLYCKPVKGSLCLACTVLDNIKSCSRTKYQQLLKCSSVATKDGPYELISQPLPADYATLSHRKGADIIIARSCDKSNSQHTSAADAPSEAAASDPAASEPERTNASTNADSSETSAERSVRAVGPSTDEVSDDDLSASEEEEEEEEVEPHNEEKDSEQRPGRNHVYKKGSAEPTASYITASKQTLQFRLLGTDQQHWSLLHFELGMLGLLAIALPVVYWRKIRIRHL